MSTQFVPVEDAGIVNKLFSNPITTALILTIIMVAIVVLFVPPMENKFEQYIYIFISYVLILSVSLTIHDKMITPQTGGAGEGSESKEVSNPAVINNIVSISADYGAFTATAVYYKNGVFIANAHSMVRLGKEQSYTDVDGKEVIYRNDNSKFDTITFLQGYEEEDVEDRVEFRNHSRYGQHNPLITDSDLAMFKVNDLHIPENVAPISIEYDLNVISQHKYIYAYFRHLGKKELTKLYNSFYAVRLIKSGEHAAEGVNEFLQSIGNPVEFVDRVFYMNCDIVHGDSGGPIFIESGGEYKLVGSVCVSMGSGGFGGVLDRDFIEQGLN